MTWSPSTATTNAPVAGPQEALPMTLPPPSLTWMPYVTIGVSRSGLCWGIPGEPHSLLPMLSHILPEYVR